MGVFINVYSMLEIRCQIEINICFNEIFTMMSGPLKLIIEYREGEEVQAF